jgi:hypothetical protein
VNHYGAAGFFVLLMTNAWARTVGELDMPTWREDALGGVTLGLLISLGVLLLLGGVVYWF